MSNRLTNLLTYITKELKRTRCSQKVGLLSESSAKGSFLSVLYLKELLLLGCSVRVLLVLELSHKASFQLE